MYFKRHPNKTNNPSPTKKLTESYFGHTYKTHVAWTQTWFSIAEYWDGRRSNLAFIIWIFVISGKFVRTVVQWKCTTVWYYAIVDKVTVMLFLSRTALFPIIDSNPSAIQLAPMLNTLKDTRSPVQENFRWISTPSWPKRFFIQILYLL